MDMMTAKIFENGGSQAVRLPKEYRFDANEVSINKIGNIVLLSPKSDKWESVLQAIDMFSEDYMAEGRADQRAQERGELWDICLIPTFAYMP